MSNSLWKQCRPPHCWRAHHPKPHCFRVPATVSVSPPLFFVSHRAHTLPFTLFLRHHFHTVLSKTVVSFLECDWVTTRQPKWHHDKKDDVMAVNGIFKGKGNCFSRITKLTRVNAMWCSVWCSENQPICAQKSDRLTTRKPPWPNEPQAQKRGIRSAQNWRQLAENLSAEKDITGFLTLLPSTSLTAIRKWTWQGRCCVRVVVVQHFQWRSLGVLSHLHLVHDTANLQPSCRNSLI